MTSSHSSGKLMLGSLALMVTIWGILGWFDLEHQTQAGFDTDGNNLVTRVYSGSPAETAGLASGDRIIKVGSYAVEDARSLSRLPRAKVDEIRLITVEREGEEQLIEVGYAPLLPRNLALARAQAFVGFCFVLFPLLALFRISNDATRLLAVMGIGFSLGFLTGPYIGDASIRAMTASISTLFVLFGVAALVQFLLIFPNRRPFLNKGYAKSLIYLPALLLWGLLAWRLLFTPAASSALNTFTGLAIGLVVGGYFLFALFRILRNYSQTDGAQRKQLGLNLMLWGTIIGLLPVTIAQLTSAFSPQSVLPGQDYYFLTIALIPLTWSRSASRRG